MNASSSLCIAGDCKTAWSDIAAVPTDMIAFFPGTACPSGWAEYTTARGRYIVGLPLSGTAEGTTGTALSNGENRAMGQHTHAVTDPGHNHTQNAHNHGVTDPTHNHTQNAHNHGVTDPGHTHTVPLGDGGSGSSLGAYPGQTNNLGTQTTNSNSTAISINNATPTNIANSTGITINNTTPTNNSNTTGLTVNSSGTVAGTNAPYVQLIACRKS